MEVSSQQIAALIGQVSGAIASGQLDSKTLQEVMSQHFGGSDASGAWGWRMAYDVMEAAFIRLIQTSDPEPDCATELQRLLHLHQSLPTQTRRSEGQIKLQQFSTPLTYAFVASQAAKLTARDVVLEPSAGTGSLAVFAGAAQVHLNEINLFRGELLKANFKGTLSNHDAEHIDDLLAQDIRPSVILMNPPFASTASRSCDPTIAARHLVAAAKRLSPGGRLVAILPRGFASSAQAAWFRRASAIVRPRLILSVPGPIYRKMGTTVETQLLVADKIADTCACEEHSISSLAQALQVVGSELSERARVSADPVPQVTPQPRYTAQGSAKMQVAPADTPCTTSSSPIGPVAFSPLPTPRVNDPVSGIYARYRPQRIDIAGAHSHPTPLVESLAMASVLPPIPRGTLSLPRKITTEGLLSETQIETVLLAASAHAQDLPGRFVVDANDGSKTRDDDNPQAVAYRQGYFIGDNTGVGKGRQAAAIILGSWLSGCRRAIWLSKSATLIEDAIRDWRDLGGSPTDVQPISKWKPDHPITMQSGILFVTYATLRAQGKGGTTRLQQILNWCGADFDGVIAFDEAHAMANATGSDAGRGVKASQQGIAGLRLQDALPRARVTYISATGATKVSNLAYAGRLGLWGPGPDYPFPSREQFVSSMEAGGLAALEIVARDLKAMGLYCARALSFEGVEYDILEHELSPAQVAIYDTYASAFRTIHTHLHRALEATGIVDPDGAVQAGAARAAAMSRFESTKQRFFSHLLLGMKAPSIIAAIEADVADGWAPVIQIVSTGESLLKRRLETMDGEDALTEGALTPRDYVLTYLESAFPIHAQELIEVDGEIISQPLRDANGALVVSQEALALREAACVELMCLAPIPSALDQLLWHFGEEAVAEVTGRSIRPLRDIDGNLAIHKRSASANSAETAAFMAGKKDILIFSDAGGTGRSYHAAITAKNQKRRRHYLLEPGWRADNAIQGLGRTHRSAQVSAPWFRVCTTNVHGEKRFTSTISARLDTLGALSKGQRETGTQGMFRAEDNLESPLARAALRGLFADLAADRAASMSMATFSDWTALKLTDRDGVLLEDLPPIQRFLNRVLALPIALQNALFGEFMERIALQTERARAAGTLELGLETLRGERIEEISSDHLWTCPKTQAVTRLIGLDVTNPIRVPNAQDAIARYGFDRHFMINRSSGQVALISARPLQVYDEEAVSLMRRVARPRCNSMIPEAKFANSAWEKISKPEFVDGWTREVTALPTSETTRMYLLTGLLLPIWRNIPSQNERIYRVTPDGRDPMIGRALSEDQAAVVRSRFMTDTPLAPKDILTKLQGSSGAVEIGQGLRLIRRRVAGMARLEIEGAEKEMIPYLTSLGCFTEVISFQLRVFLPSGDGTDPASIIAKLMGKGKAAKGMAA